MPCIEDAENGVCINRTLEETKTYLGTPIFNVYYNTERFNIDKFDSYDRFTRESKVIEQKFSLSDPHSMNCHIHVNEIEDETDYFQVG